MITRESVAAQRRDYLQHRITRVALVDWAEHAIMEEEFDERDSSNNQIVGLTRVFAVLEERE